MKVEIWSDIACPWCSIGKARFEKALSEYPHRDAVEVSWRSYQLQPDAPQTGAQLVVDELMGKYGRSREQVLGMMASVTEAGAGEGIAFRLDEAIAANTFDAHRTVKFAEAAGVGQAVMSRLMHAYHGEGLNVADHEVLVRLGTEAGLDEAELRAMLAGDAYAAEVRADIERGARLGVSGVPFFVIDGQHGLSGAQPPEVFLSALEQLGPQEPKLQMLAGDGVTCTDDGCTVTGD